MAFKDDQHHPFYQRDRVRVNELLNSTIPTSSDLVDLARFHIRYQGFPGAYDLQEDLAKILKNWNMNVIELNKSTRELWQSGDPLETKVEESMGSGFDTLDKDEDD